MKSGQPTISFLWKSKTAIGPSLAFAAEDQLTRLLTAVSSLESEAAARIYHDTNVYDGITASSHRFG